MTRFTTGWYVMYTKAHHEQKVARQLTDLTIPHYLPTIRVTGPGKNVILIREKPLFPSYVFVHLNEPANLYKSTSVDGYSRYVKFGNEMATIAEHAIMNLKLITEKGRCIEVKHDELQTGQKLVITQGPLSGIGCQVVKHNQKNVQVTVHLLGKIVTATIARQHLVPV